ncbi:MAG: ABC transporter ATP-binding protein/permease [Erysipelotrichaceae bacterium]|nr:ABC transporter ATP-binding protein/permease [Erysipelotrichaceae bacterium]
MIFGKHINKYYLKYSYALLLGILALLAVDYFQLRIPEIYGTIIDGLDPTKDFKLTKELLNSLCLDMLVIVIIMVIGRFLWRVCFFLSAIKVETNLRKEMFAHCKELSQNYYQHNKVGNLMSLFTNDIDTINECFGHGILMAFDALCLGGMAIYKMFRLNIVLTILSLIPMILLGFMSVIVGKYMMKKWKLRQEAFSSLSDFSQESFSGIAVIKAFVKESKELLAFKKINKNNENANVEFTKASVLLNVFVAFFINSIVCIILAVGGYYAYKGQFDAGELVRFVSYFNSIVWPIMAVSSLIEMTSRGKASLDRINNLLESEVEVKDKDDVINSITSINGKIQYKNLTFTYPDSDIKALDNVSFTIQKGENIGIIGKTGSGKTTLVDLLLRTYNVDDNSIFIDDIDINKIPIKTIRKFASYVPQDNFLFSDTIANNIAFSSDNKVEDDKIKEVSILADLDENVKDFKDGYDTMLGERGVTISGGQKQRTSIARALLKDASILILDDAVSAVDTKTEKIIIDNLKKTRKGKTTILIAHRISTIEQMDKVLFIDDGKIIAFGTHEQLLSSCEQYKQMVELQRLEDECGGGNA